MSGIKPAGPLVLKLREWAIFGGWLCGLVLLGGILWFLTQPIRTQSLMRSVNRVLAQRGEPRRLATPLPDPRSPGSSVLLGHWYSLEKSEDLFFVFTLMRDGPMALCGVQVSPQGKAGDILPLSGHAEQIIKDMPPGMLQIYIRRIEALGIPDAGRKNE
ncbi:MAG: hypothetical protein LBK02_01755 [Treponema sp.]|jgi:hypothetical protein|nr:hypothetical protein [Treponema sp.]